MNSKILAIFIAFLLPSCGGGGGSSHSDNQTTSSVISKESSSLSSSSSTSSSGEVINGIVVPPEPDEKLNNSTIAGVDSDNNGIRDDIDREIARSFGGQVDKFSSAQRDNFHLQKVMVDGGSDAIDNYKKFIDCINDENLLIELDIINKKLLNTPERESAYANSLAGLSGTIGGNCENQ